MAVEIERKFLLDSKPEFLGNCLPVRIKQGYLIVADDGTELRIRQAGNKYTQTLKRPGELTRVEIEIEITEKQFEVLWPEIVGNSIEKDRYQITYKDHLLEVDIYRKELSGLMVVEVEFVSVNSSDSFILPDYFGREVTYDKEFKNRYLALIGLKLM